MGSFLHNRGLVLGAASVALGVTFASGQLSEAWVAYLANPDAHPNIPNVSHAGYGGGGVPLPDGSGNPLVSVTDFGATGNGVSDDTAAVRLAIAVAAGQADPSVTVYFPAGTYKLSGPLLIHDDGVELRGAGRGETTLHFTESLTTSYAAWPGSDPGDSNWSFNGGMIWFTDASRDPYYAGVPTITTANGGWRLTDTRDVTAAASYGDREITVSSAAGYAPGDVVAIEIDNAADFSTLRHLLGDGEWAQNYMFTAAKDGNILPSGTSAFRVYHTIEAVDGNRVTLREPLRYDLRPEWDPEMRRPMDLRRRVGLADMTVRLGRDYQWLVENNHNKEPGFNGVAFNSVVDGFMERVTIVDPGGLGVFVQRSKNVTVKDLVIDSTGPNRLEHHHGVGLANASDCLVTDFEIRTQPHHGIYVGNFSVANVYSRGVMAGGTFDYHKRLPYANVYTEIDIVNNGDSGGDSASGPQMGARHVHWNVNANRTSSRLIAQPDVMPMGAIVGVRCTTPAEYVSAEHGNPEAIVDTVGPGAAAPNPRNLYEAQLALRLGGTPDDGQGVPACDGCQTDTAYGFDFGGGIGQGLIGQDNWEYGRDFIKSDGLNVRLQVEATPVGPLFAAVSTAGRDSVISRQNDHRYAFTPHRHTDTTAKIRFEGRAGVTGGGGGNAYLIINNSAGRDEGVQFGLRDGEFLIRGGRFSGVLQRNASVPSGWYGRGEWFRLELRIDFTANGGDGAASLFFMNLSDGDTQYRAVPGLQGVPLVGEVRYPETWDRIEFRIRNDAAVSNIVPNVGASERSCCEADLDGDGQLTAAGDVLPFLALAEGLDPRADLDGVAGVEYFDVLEFLRRFDAGCP